jgi:hypothetical protein
MLVALDQVQRACKQAEYEATDFREQVNDLSGQNNSLSATKRKLEGEMQAMHVSKLLSFIHSLNTYMMGDYRPTSTRR